MGHSHPNPLIDTREYEVEFPDGSINVLMVDAIAEAMYSQVNEQGQSNAVLSEIVDHQKDGMALEIDDSFNLGTGQC
jgi:hypothetical protein